VAAVEERFVEIKAPERFVGYLGDFLGAMS
jgi:hypothetical protein